MAKGKVPSRRRAPVIRVQTRRRAVVRPKQSAPGRRRAPSVPSSTSMARSTTITVGVSAAGLRAMRVEKRSLVQQLSAVEREKDEMEQRAKVAEKERNALLEEEKRSLVQQLAAVEREKDETEQRAKAAEKVRNALLEEEKRSLVQQLAAVEREKDAMEQRAKSAEQERNALLEEESVVFDEGTELWQNVWHQLDVSSVLTFPTNKSVVCKSVEDLGGSSMPGVHATGTIDKGRITQSIWLKGSGYTLVGLVTSEEEKEALRHHAGDDFSKMPLMTTVFSGANNEHKGDVFTIEVDMTERSASLYVSGQSSIGLVEPHTVWKDLPSKVWVAVAFKRNSGREAVLMPCIHWKMETGEEVMQGSHKGRI